MFIVVISSLPWRHTGTIYQARTIWKFCMPSTSPRLFMHAVCSSCLRSWKGPQWDVIYLRLDEVQSLDPETLLEMAQSMVLQLLAVVFIGNMGWNHEEQPNGDFVPKLLDNFRSLTLQNFGQLEEERFDPKYPSVSPFVSFKDIIFLFCQRYPSEHLSDARNCTPKLAEKCPYGEFWTYQTKLSTCELVVKAAQSRTRTANWQLNRFGVLFWRGLGGSDQRTRNGLI